MEVKEAPTNPMTSGLSVFLDLIRLLAACAVVISHLAGPEFSNFGAKGGAGLGVFAVGIFFLLSGFVIECSVVKSKPTLRDYLEARFARIYSVLVPGLGLTYLLLVSGIALFPPQYARYGLTFEAPELKPGEIARQLLSCLTFLNESPWLRAAPPTDGPLWSLGYEVPYYLWFAGLTFGRGVARWIWLPIAALLWGPAVFILFPAWLGGVLLFKVLSRWQVSKKAGAASLVALIGVALLAAVINSWWLHFDRPGVEETPLIIIMKSVANNRSSGWPLIYGGAIAMALMIVAARAFDSELTRLLEAPKKLIRVLAAATFSIYLFHLPLLWFLCASPVYHRNQPIDLILAFTLVLTICFALSRVTEAKKDGWRRLLARLQSAS